MDLDDAIYEAAESSTVRKNPKWPVLKAFLRKRGVALNVLESKTHERWMAELSEAMETLDALDIDVEEAERKKQKKILDKSTQDGSNKVDERGRSMESTRQSDGDSGYHSERSDLCNRPEAVNFLVPDHETYDDGKAALYCSYCETDDRNYIARAALNKLNFREGEDGSLILSFIDGDKSSVRKFIVQDSTSDGEKFKSDIRFGMKTPVESVEEESPLEEISNVAFDGGDDQRTILQIHNALMTPRKPLRQLQDDEAKVIGYAVGLSAKDTIEELADLDLGHRLGLIAGAAMESFPR